MKALIIIGIIVGIFVLILNIPVVLHLSFIGGKFALSVKYAFFTLFPRRNKQSEDNSDSDKEQKKPAKKAIKKKRSKAESTDKSAEEGDGEKKKEKPKKSKEEILEIIGLVKTLLQSCGKGVRRIIRGIRIYDIELDFDVANLDACDCAINYGKMNIAVYNVLSFLRIFFTIEINHVNITCKYNSDESRYDGSCTVRLRPATVIAAALSIGVRFLINIAKQKISETKVLKNPADTKAG